MITEEAAFISPPDMIILMAVALVVFGPKKLPEVGRQLGQVMRELKKLTSDLTDSLHSETSEIRNAFDTTSPYSLKAGPVDVHQERPVLIEGYSKDDPMGESPVLHQAITAELTDVPVARTAHDVAAVVPLTPTAHSKIDGEKL